MDCAGWWHFFVTFACKCSFLVLFIYLNWFKVHLHVYSPSIHWKEARLSQGVCLWRWKFLDINFLMASSSSFSVLCINHTKVSVSQASCCGPPTFPNSSLLASSYAVHRFSRWTSSSTSSRSHVLHLPGYVPIFTFMYIWGWKFSPAKKSN